MAQSFYNFGQGLSDIRKSIKEDDAFVGVGGGQGEQPGNARHHLGHASTAYETSRQDQQDQHDDERNKNYVIVPKDAKRGYKQKAIFINQMDVSISL